VDAPNTLIEILEAVQEIAEQLPIVFPCHPRTRQKLEQLNVQHLQGLNGQYTQDRKGGLMVIDPLGYLEFLSLMDEASLVLTDSGGIQEETTVLGIPCLTLRDNTERPVTVEQGMNVLVGPCRKRILEAARKALTGGRLESRVPDLWDGKAADRIASILVHRLDTPSLGNV
jgi:UDP-N-acetylglucosamine 2-epimerase (non-hydrolysing)